PTGRQPGLVPPHGIRYLRTSAGHVYAAGDCTSPLQFTHVGDEQGQLAARNAFAPGCRPACPAARPRSTTASSPG
ncbi:MAG: hypothetical protein M3P46_11490, partial [Actinomycetota bacterium]|nr:hypothetical protein [Actinomycetota bacterium]